MSLGDLLNLHWNDIGTYAWAWLFVALLKDWK